VKPLLHRTILYEGRYDDGKKSGKGDFVFPNGDFYRGNFTHDLKDGYGMLVSFQKNFVYKGDFKLDSIKGHGICLFSNGMVIEGNFIGVSFIII
jgi:hypothetical protein